MASGRKSENVLSFNDSIHILYIFFLYIIISHFSTLIMATYVKSCIENRTNTSTCIHHVRAPFKTDSLENSDRNKPNIKRTSLKKI